MRTVLVILLALAPLAFVPTAAAASCASVTEPALGTPPVYVVPAGVSAEVWTEANNVPGLQRVLCQNAAGQTVAADSYWITVGPGTAFEVIDEVERATGCQIGVPVRCIF